MFLAWFPEIVLRGSFPVWLAILFLVAAAGIAVAFYFTESMKLRTSRRLALAGLRALILCSIVLLLCKPVAARDVRTEKARPVVVLADNRQTTTQKDPRPTVADKGRPAIARDRPAAAHPRGRGAGRCRGAARRPPEPGGPRQGRACQQADRPGRQAAGQRPSAAVPLWLAAPRVRRRGRPALAPVAQGRGPQDAPD